MEIETPKRKPTTQEQIIRQSCLRTAVDFHTKEETNKKVLEIAKEFEEWVHRKV